jgi:hypothetical protein
MRATKKKSNLSLLQLLRIVHLLGPDGQGLLERLVEGGVEVALAELVGRGHPCVGVEKLQVFVPDAQEKIN